MHRRTCSDYWNSPRAYKVPRWFEDAKFEIFLHWGVYPAPAFSSEWYSRIMHLEGTRWHAHRRETYGAHSEAGYEDFLPFFTMEDDEPGAWAGLLCRAGAQFVVPVAEEGPTRSQAGSFVERAEDALEASVGA